MNEKINNFLHSFNAFRLISAMIFFFIGIALGVRIFRIYGLSLIVVIFLFAFVGYAIPPIIGQHLANFFKTIVDRIASEVARQTRAVLPERIAPKPVSPAVSDILEEDRHCPPHLLDTSAIIDGRIIEVIRTGFMHGLIVVPKFVLQELQRVADSSDRLHRERGRRGFEILEEIKEVKRDSYVTLEKGLPRGKDVDERLVKLGKKLSGVIVTVDYNLNKVARLSNVEVFNINELANALRPMVVPGELLHIKVVQEGKEAGQGVGYLADGTMVVVEEGEQLIGTETDVTVSRFLQTDAGRMIFATYSDDGPAENSK